MTTILLIEDQAPNSEMLSRRLRKRGYEVLIAEDGESGLATAEANVPDLVLMDMSLPGIDGLACTRRLKANTRTRHIPVIALTGHASAAYRLRALESGCDDFETKPIDFARLAEKIQNLLAN
jgi:two-component system, cell cycle response regulator DivK